MYKKLSKEELCCKCQEKGKNLIKPCNNNDCIVRIHQGCLTKQIIDENNTFCIGCHEPVYSKTVNKLNKVNCCMNLFDWMVNIIFCLCVPATLLSMALPKILEIDISKNVIYFILSLVCTLFLICANVILIASPTTDHPMYEKIMYILNLFDKIRDILPEMSDRLFDILTKFILLASENLFILLCHFVGWMISNVIFGINEFFTYRTCAYSYILIMSFIIICMILICLNQVRLYLIQNNSEEIIVFGIKTES